MVTIQNGTLEDFFDSALRSAKQIDENQKVTPKHTIWMETEDLLNILKYNVLLCQDHLTKYSYSTNLCNLL